MFRTKRSGGTSQIERLKPINVLGALRSTLYRFDRELDVASIRDADSWTKRFGGKRVSEKTLKKRLLAEVSDNLKPPALGREVVGCIVLSSAPLQEREALKARG